MILFNLIVSILEIIHGLCLWCFWNQSYSSIINSNIHYIMFKEVIGYFPHAIFNHTPGFLEEFRIKSIYVWSFVYRMPLRNVQISWSKIGWIKAFLSCSYMPVVPIMFSRSLNSSSYTGLPPTLSLTFRILLTSPIHIQGPCIDLTMCYISVHRVLLLASWFWA